MLITLRQIKKISKLAKKILEILINLYVPLQINKDSIRIIKSINDFKRSKRLNLKEGD